MGSKGEIGWCKPNSLCSSMASFRDHSSQAWHSFFHQTLFRFPTYQATEPISPLPLMTSRSAQRLTSSVLTYTNLDMIKLTSSDTRSVEQSESLSQVVIPK